MTTGEITLMALVGQLGILEGSSVFFKKFMPTNIIPSPLKINVIPFLCHRMIQKT